MKISVGYVVFLCLAFGALGQVTADMYLPSLPAIHTGLQISVHLAQATVFAFMLGYAISRLFYGPLSDAIGRKKPLIFGLSLCCFGSILCATASNITILLSGRLLQGLGVGASVIIAGAIIRDLAEPKKLSYFFSFTTLTNIFVIAAAPVLGGYFQHYFGWKSNFIFLAIYTTISLFIAIFMIKETNQHTDINNIKPKKIAKNIVTLANNKDVVSYCICIFLNYAGIIAWLTLGPILLQKQLGLSPVDFGWIILIISVFYAFGSLLNSKAVQYFSANKILKMSFITHFFAGMLMLTFALFGLLNVWVVVVPVIVYMLVSASIFANGYAGALIPFPKLAGISMGVLGFSQILGGVLASGVIALLPDNNQIPLAISFVICGGLGYWLIKRLRLNQ